MVEKDRKADYAAGDLLLQYLDAFTWIVDHFGLPDIDLAVSDIPKFVVHVEMAMRAATKTFKPSEAIDD